MWICSAFSSVEAFPFEDVFCLPPAIHLNKQVSISYFLYVFEGSSYRNYLFYSERDNLAWHTSSKDSMTMDLGKSAASFFETGSDKFLLIFFLLENVPSDIYFLLVLCSITNHRVQLMFGMYLEGNLLNLGWNNQYTRAGNRFSRLVNFRFLTKVTNYHVI